jgi:vacuolar protein sorting-associated protein 13A/C
MHDHSFLLVSTSYFERKSIANLKLDAESENVMDRDMGFWVGLSSEGVWECVRSLLPVSVVPKSLQNDFIAMEVVMKNGKKHVIFRGLATLVNDSDVKLGISICHVSSIHGHNRSSGTSSFNIVPGASAVLPWRSTSKDSDECLLVRPCVNHPEPPYSWGCAVAVGSGYAYGKDQSCIDQGSLYRQKQETKMPNFTFKLNQLEKKDILLRCSSTGSRQFWLSVGADASVLHTELNAPVYDWRISINSPLKLESRLPCPAEFTIWEKTKEGNCVERQHGIISSRRSVHICSADIQKSIYLTLFVQGGWVLEKVITLV